MVGVDLIRCLLEQRYPTQALAAKAWGMSDSQLSRVLARKVPISRAVADKIAKATGSRSQDLLQTNPNPQLTLSRNDAHARSVPQLQVNIDDPAGLLMQVDNWLANVPTSRRLRSSLKRAVMRTIYDTAFDDLSPPTKAWRVVMAHVDAPDDGSSRAVAGLLRQGQS